MCFGDVSRSLAKGQSLVKLRKRSPSRRGKLDSSAADLRCRAGRKESREGGCRDLDQEDWSYRCWHHKFGE